MLLHMEHSEDLELLAAGCSGGKKITCTQVFGQVHGKKIIYSQQLLNTNTELLVQGIPELPGEDPG